VDELGCVWTTVDGQGTLASNGCNEGTTMHNTLHSKTLENRSSSFCPNLLHYKEYNPKATRLKSVLCICLKVEHQTNTGWAKKTGPFLNVDNFATVSGRKACDMSKVCKFCLEKSIKLA